MKLRFFSPPVFIGDPPGELDNADHPSVEFIAHRSWIHSQLRFLRELSLVNDKQEDSNLKALLHEFMKEDTRLAKIEHDVWMREMVVAGLLRMDGTKCPKPIVVDPRAYPLNFETSCLVLTSYRSGDV